MFEQLSFFDLGQPEVKIPEVNEKGFIPAEELVPTRYEAWKYSNDNLSLRDGPYIIDAFVAILPGNRLYVKDWMLYPFMHEMKTAMAVEKAYHKAKESIEERIQWNDEHKRTWKIDSLPALEDMWKYKDGEYSCKDYAEKMLYGYKGAPV